jgi:hypothetical protein
MTWDTHGKEVKCLNYFDGKTRKIHRVEDLNVVTRILFKLYSPR